MVNQIIQEVIKHLSGRHNQKLHGKVHNQNSYQAAKKETYDFIMDKFGAIDDFGISKFNETVIAPGIYSSSAPKPKPTEYVAENISSIWPASSIGDKVSFEKVVSILETQMPNGVKPRITSLSGVLSNENVDMASDHIFGTVKIGNVKLDIHGINTGHISFTDSYGFRNEFTDEEYRESEENGIGLYLDTIDGQLRDAGYNSMDVGSTTVPLQYASSRDYSYKNETDDFAKTALEQTVRRQFYLDNGKPPSEDDVDMLAASNYGYVHLQVERCQPDMMIRDLMRVKDRAGRAVMPNFILYDPSTATPKIRHLPYHKELNFKKKYEWKHLFHKKNSTGRENL